MNSEQIYSLGMAQISLVFFLASYRIRPQLRDQPSLNLLQWVLLTDAASWLLYLDLQDNRLLVLSSLISAANLWLFLAYACRRVYRPVPWLWLGVAAVVHGGYYSYFTVQQQQLWTLHGQTVFTALALLPAIWLIVRVKLQRTFSDVLFIAALVLWLLVCLGRSFILVFWPEWLLSGQLLTQAIWPGVTVAYGIFAMTGYLEEIQNRLRDEALQDPLTGLLNRRGLSEAVRACLCYLQRRLQPAALLMIDLDHFKQLNDQCGHDVGDQILMQLATAVNRQLRQSDVLARFGGEEFVLFLPNTDQAQAGMIAQRVLLAVNQLPIPVNATNPLSVSIGIALFGPDYDFASELKKADQALYRAKHLGRNRIEFAS